MLGDIDGGLRHSPANRIRQCEHMGFRSKSFCPAPAPAPTVLGGYLAIVLGGVRDRESHTDWDSPLTSALWSCVNHRLPPNVFSWDI